MSYKKTSNPIYANRKRSLKVHNHVELRVKGCLDRNGVKPGNLFAQQFLRDKAKIDPRSFRPENMGLIRVPIKGDARAKIFLRPNKNLQVVDLSNKT